MGTGLSPMAMRVDGTMTDLNIVFPIKGDLLAYRQLSAARN